ncbi:MAG: amidase [Thermoleophilia bacterium]
MPTGPKPPTLQQLLDIAEDFGIELTEDDAEDFRSLMVGTMDSYRRVETYPELRPEVKYPRTPGYRPAAEDNPFNAWYWRCRIEGADSGPLKGVEVGIKDCISVAGVPMMNGCQVFEGFVPDVDATVVTRLLDAGATVVGKTNAADCSFSGSGHTCAHGPVRNPRRPTHSPGGSSKGSGAAVAAGDVTMALGADQGGSIRIPGAWCGIVGMKPTYGLVPYTGCMMIEMTLDTCGPMTDTVESAARMLSAIAGPDPLDPRQRGVCPPDWVSDYLPALGAGVQGLRIGVVREGFDQPEGAIGGLPGSDPGVDAAVRATIQRLEAAGAIATEISIPMHVDAFHVWNVVAIEGATEFMLKGRGAGTNWEGFYNTNLIDMVGRGFDSRATDFPTTVKLLLLLGEHMYRAYHGRYYAKAQNVRHLTRRAYDDALASYDVLVMPTIPIVSKPIPERDAAIPDSVFHSLCMIQNTPQFNVTGHPAISVPCGVVDGLPVGFQVVGRHFDDLTVLRVADAVERSADWQSC